MVRSSSLALVLLCFFGAVLADSYSELNPFLKDYGKLNYDRVSMQQKVSRARRSQEPYLFFTFNSHNREFKIKISPSGKNNFATSSIEINNNTRVPINSYVSNFYSGVLVDEPDSSSVSGIVLDGVFYGTIASKTHGKYFVESAKRYNHSLDCHSIIYNEKDINLERLKAAKSAAKTKRAATGADATGAAPQLDDQLGCGANLAKVKDWMSREQESLFKERDRLEGFDPYTYIDSHDYDETAAKQKYTKEANENRYRRNSEPIRLTFPERRTMCNLYLRVDPILFKEIYRNEGNQNEETTTTFLLFYLNKHVEALNSIFNSLTFYNADKSRYYVGVQFMIHRTKIITFDQCKASPPSLSREELSLCEPFLDVSTFLNHVSMDDFNGYCLAFTFTARDFADGTLGLAWVAKLSGSLGGVCERRQTLQGVGKSLNSGIVTVVNYQARVPEAVSQLTFGHEVGHSFGSEHDPDEEECSPGGKAGNYIMYRRATTGMAPNNRNFSACSRNRMGPVMHALVQNRKKFCFKPYDGSLCGNGIVEEGEECDCGYREDCKDPCCYDASEDVGKQCRLKPSAKCSPSQGPCCDIHTCDHASSRTVCMQSNECHYDIKCTGDSSLCPHNDSKFFMPDLTTCNSGTQVCIKGVCAGSICEKYDMVQCFMEGNLRDKKQDKSVLCHLACSGKKTNDACVDSFDISEMINPATNSSGFILKPGSPCLKTLGYCDIFSKCRAVDGEGPLARLKNLLLNPVTLSKIRLWVTKFWWAAVLLTVAFMVLTIGAIKVCSVHTPSSNPNRPAALKFSDTLRRPIKRYRMSPQAPTNHMPMRAKTVSEIGADPHAAERLLAIAEESNETRARSARLPTAPAASKNKNSKSVAADMYRQSESEQGGLMSQLSKNKSNSKSAGAKMSNMK